MKLNEMTQHSFSAVINKRSRINNTCGEDGKMLVVSVQHKNQV